MNKNWCWKISFNVEKIRVEFYTVVKMKEYITNINRDGSHKYDTEWKKSKFRKNINGMSIFYIKPNTYNTLYCLRTFLSTKNIRRMMNPTFKTVIPQRIICLYSATPGVL